MESYKPEYNLDDFDLDQGERAVFINIMDELRSGRAVWLPRSQDSDIIDLFHDKKYQGYVKLVDIDNEGYVSYKVNPENPGEAPLLLTSAPTDFKIAAEALLDYPK